MGEKNSNLSIDYSFEIEDYVILSSDEIFINPHLNKEPDNDLIDQSTTTESIYYSYKSLKSNQYCFSIPSGFEVTYLPENVKYVNDDFNFSINYTVSQDVIDVQQILEINTLQLKTEQFGSWNEMMKKLFAAYKESIVLGKI